jgi:hypothetical protein
LVGLKTYDVFISPLEARKRRPAMLQRPDTADGTTVASMGALMATRTVARTQDTVNESEPKMGGGEKTCLG